MKDTHEHRLPHWTVMGLRSFAKQRAHQKPPRLNIDPSGSQYALRKPPGASIRYQGKTITDSNPIAPAFGECAMSEPDVSQKMEWVTTDHKPKLTRSDTPGVKPALPVKPPSADPSLLVGSQHPDLPTMELRPAKALPTIATAPPAEPWPTIATAPPAEPPLPNDSPPADPPLPNDSPPCDTPSYDGYPDEESDHRSDDEVFYSQSQSQVDMTDGAGEELPPGGL